MPAVVHSGGLTSGGSRISQIRMADGNTKAGGGKSERAQQSFFLKLYENKKMDKDEGLIPS